MAFLHNRHGLTLIGREQESVHTGRAVGALLKEIAQTHSPDIGQQTVTRWRIRSCFGNLCCEHGTGPQSRVECVSNPLDLGCMDQRIELIVPAICHVAIVHQVVLAD